MRIRGMQAEFGGLPSPFFVHYLPLHTHTHKYSLSLFLLTRRRLSFQTHTHADASLFKHSHADASRLSRLSRLVLHTPLICRHMSTRRFSFQTHTPLASHVDAFRLTHTHTHTHHAFHAAVLATMSLFPPTRRFRRSGLGACQFACTIQSR
jgi:hypothetical protein